MREEPLIELTKEVLGIRELNRRLIESKIQTIEVHDNNLLIFKLKDGSSIEKEWSYRSRSESWTDEMKEKARIDGAKASRKEKKNG